MAFRKNITAAQTDSELQTVVQAATGSSGLMEFTRFDLGEVLRKELGSRSPQAAPRGGNPVIMKQMVKFVPDAGSYAPETILVDERSDGVHISYDEMVSFLATLRKCRSSSSGKGFGHQGCRAFDGGC